MKILLAAATALTMSGAALAYQTYTSQPDVQAGVSASVTLDPTIAISPPATWTDQQRSLWEQHMATMPAHWTVEQRTAFHELMAIPPANWTVEQRTLYTEHMASLPPTWTAQQRTLYQQQTAGLGTPWLGVGQTASVAATGDTTLAMGPIGPRIVQPSNANPERDARGIVVISDPAIVPDGYNLFPGTGMGGPLVDPVTGETISGAERNYPACTATVTDNCIQLYERGVRASLASWNRATGGLDQADTGMGGPYEPVDDHEQHD